MPTHDYPRRPSQSPRRSRPGLSLLSGTYPVEIQASNSTPWMTSATSVLRFRHDEGWEHLLKEYPSVFGGGN